MNKENTEYCDIESKIEIDEDMVFKTESSDLSEFLQETSKDPSIVEDDNIQGDDWNEEDDLPTPKFNIGNIVKDLTVGKEYLILSENSLFPYTWEVSISSLDNLKEFLDFFIPKLMEI